MKTAKPELVQVKGSVLSTKKGNIFLIDDNPVFLAILESEIKEIFPSTEIYTYTSGERAMKDMRKTNPFLVFLDYNLAGPSLSIMNGLAVLKKIKKDSPRTEVVMLSGVDDLKIITTAIRYGALNYILKGEKHSVNIKREVINILRNMRNKEEKSSGGFPTDLSKWFLLLVILIFFILMMLVIH